MERNARVDCFACSQLWPCSCPRVRGTEHQRKRPRPQCLPHCAERTVPVRTSRYTDHKRPVLRLVAPAGEGQSWWSVYFGAHPGCSHLSPRSAFSLQPRSDFPNCPQNVPYAYLSATLDLIKVMPCIKLKKQETRNAWDCPWKESPPPPPSSSPTKTSFQALCYFCLWASGAELELKYYQAFDVTTVILIFI